MLPVIQEEGLEQNLQGTVDQAQIQSLNVFHFPQQRYQSFIGILEVSPGLKQYWPSLKHKYKDLTNYFGQARTLWFSEQVELEPWKFNKDLEARYQQLDFDGPSDLFQAMKALMELLRTGEATEDVVVLMIVDGQLSNQQELEQKLKGYLPEFQEISSKHSIKFQILSIGNDFPQTTMNLIGQALGQQKEENSLYQIQVPANAEVYAEILHFTFKELEESISQNWIRVEKLEIPLIPGIAKYALKYINVPYIATTTLKEISYYHQGEQINVSPLEQLNFGVDDIGLCQSFIHELRRLSRSEDSITDEVIRARQILEETQKWAKQDQSELKQENDNLFQEKLDLLNRLDQAAYLKQQVTDHKTIKLVNVNPGEIIWKWGLTTKAFEWSCQQLHKIITQGDIDLENSGQERSVVNFVNQKDVFADPEYLEILHRSSNPYEALLHIPLVGQGLHIVKPTHEDQIWWNSAQKVPVCHSIYDSSSLYFKGQMQSVIHMEGGSDVVNVVLPLFDHKDNDLKPFLRSKFFDTLMTIQVLKTAEICHPEMHAILMSRYFLHLITKPDSSWRTQQLDLIYNTYKMKYDDYDPFNRIMAQLISEQPQQAFLNPLSKTTITPSLKIVLLLFILERDVPAKLQATIQKILRLLILSSYQPSAETLDESIKATNITLQKRDQLISNICDGVETKPRTLEDFQESLFLACSNYDYQPYWDVTLTLVKNKLKFRENCLSLQQLEALHNYFQTDKFENNVLAVLHQHVAYKQQYRRFNNEFQPAEIPEQFFQRRAFQQHFNLHAFTHEVLQKMLERTQLIPSYIRKLTEFDSRIVVAAFKETLLDASNFEVLPGHAGIQNSCICMECYFYLHPFPYAIHPCWCQKYTGLEKVESKGMKVIQEEVEQPEEQPKQKQQSSEEPQQQNPLPQLARVRSLSR